MQVGKNVQVEGEREAWQPQAFIENYNFSATKTLSDVPARYKWIWLLQQRVSGGSLTRINEPPPPKKNANRCKFHLSM